jgi:hypothetical protein
MRISNHNRGPELNTQIRTLFWITFTFIGVCFGSEAIGQRVAIVQQGVPLNAKPAEAGDDDLDDDLDDAAAQKEGLVGFEQMQINRQSIRDSLFSSLGGSEAAFQKLKRESIRREIDRIDSICDLTEEQLAKLGEAVELDVQHDCTRIESMLAGFDSKMNPMEMQEYYQKIFTFASELNSPKNVNAGVWHKVLKGQLTDEQRAKIVQDETKIAMIKLRAKRLRSVLSLQRKLGLTAKQRSKIDEWMQKADRLDLDFPSLCKAVAISPELSSVFTPVQLKSLESPLPKAIIVAPMQADDIPF